MAKTTAEIKKEITSLFISNDDIIAMYGLDVTKTFEEQFSLVSLENIIFSIVAFCMSIHEQIVSKNAENSRPQNQANFREAILDFHDGLDLTWLDGRFQYDLSNVQDAGTRKIIKRCAVLESDDGELVVKIATENNGSLEPILPVLADRVLAYIKKIKVPGIKIRLINTDADLLKSVLTVYVNPLIIDLQTGKLLSVEGDVYPVKEAIKSYLQNLEFNGAFVKDFYRRTITDAVGIELVTIDVLQQKFGSLPFTDLGEFKVASSGYYKQNDADLTITYLPYVLENS